MIRNILLLAVAVLVCTSCGGQRAKKSAEGETDAQEQTGAQGQQSSKNYAMPAIPPLISDPAGKAEWAAHHFWDNFPFADTTLVGSRKDYTEQAFVDYVQLLRGIPIDLGGESVGILFRKAAIDKNMFLHMAEVAEKYLFDANSPYRDDEHYILVLRAELASDLLDKWERIRPEEQLKLSLKNRRGHPANDFRYTLASGASGSLYGLRSPYTLLFFNNPGCPSCRETQQQLMESTFITRMIAEGHLTILAVYPDQDLDAWREYSKSFPKSWIYSYDKPLRIKNEELYDLKAIPTMYLLDKNKTVMLKDVMSIPLIEETIYNDMP